MQLVSTGHLRGNDAIHMVQNVTNKDVWHGLDLTLVVVGIIISCSPLKHIENLQRFDLPGQATAFPGPRICVSPSG